MIDRTVTWLNLLIGAFIAGAIVCAVALAETLLGRPVTGYDLPFLFLAVALFTSAMRIKGQVSAEAARHGLLLESDRLALDERRARLQPVAPVAAVETPIATPEDTTNAWRLAVETFLLAGEANGFSIRKMAGVVGSDTWPLLTGWLSEQEILAVKPRVGYTWADGMTLPRALMRVRAQGCPFPAGPAPVVSWAYNDKTRRNATPQSATVIENQPPT